MKRQANESEAAPTQAETATALAHTRCPLCGGTNGCVPAACGRFDQPCWCTGANFSAALLARVPEAQRGRACICATCAAVG